ncbi:MAG TPA: hypothetical protein PLH56_02510, partial [Candidatus Omnitrophota bacterium]|nr:hypothetical protein [Candidatus Omnitrophota bacterium]
MPASELGLATAFVPPLLKGIKVDLNKPFNFDFVLDTGSNRQQTTANGLKDESTKLIKYFLASLAIPEKDLWVNLNPKEPDRIVSNEFGQTEMGRDLLAQDYILKQIAASLMNPEGEVGKVFWKKIYKEAYEKFGTTDVPVDALNKVWIVPAKAVVYENPSTEPGQATAFVVEAKLKVLLEEEYLKTNDKRPMTKDQPLAGKKSLVSGLRSSVSDLIRSVIIPVLEKEVNESEHFAQLRQVYYSLILAKWYKETLKESILNKKYSDQKKVTGVDILNKNEKEKIYQQYLETFRKGVVNYIKEEYDPVTKSLVPRKYFSGGGDFTNLQLSKVTDLAMVSKLATLGAMLLLISGILLSPNNKILEVKNSNAIKMEDNLKPTSINNVNISKLTQYINQNFGIIGGVEESQIRRSLEISNLPEYQDFVAATYKILEKIGIKDKVPILFLEGYDNPNMAFALQEAGIIMVGAGIFKNLTLQEKIALLAPKIAHEAVHIQYPHLSILEQEALAYEKTAEALDLFNGEPGIITITENISRAFRAIVDNPSEILRTLRAKSLGPINYDDISIQGSEGTIKLYNMVNKKRMDFKFNTGLVKKMDSVSDSKDNAMKTDELEILSPQEAREYIYINFSEELSKNQQRALSEEKALIENVRLMPNQRSIILSKQHIH